MSAGDRAPGLPARLAPRAARAHRVGARATGAGRRADQAAHRQGREPRHGAHRGRGARLAAGALRDQARRWTRTTSACSSTAAARSTRRPCISASPATTSSTSPTASCCARARHVEPWVEFEMLEGMANHQARAVQARAGGLLLYAPVVRAEDFHSAIAYLVRRLDENTAPENFLRHVFDLEPGSRGVDRRARSLPGRVRARGGAVRCAAPHPGPERRGGRRPPRAGRAPPSREVRERARHRLDAGRQPRVDRATSFMTGRRGPRRRSRSRSAASSAPGARRGEGHDPSRPERVAYRYALAGRADVDRALTAARRAQPAWAALTIDERGAKLEACAAELGRRRGDLIGAMIARRRQDRDRGRRRGLGGDRLRALLRPDARARSPARSATAAWSRSASWSSRRRGTSRSRSPPAACSPRSRPGTPSCSSRRRRRCWSAGDSPAASGTPASRARSSSSCPAPTTRSAAGS